MAVAVPHAGWFWLRLWLEDEAGNVNPSAKTNPVMLRFDNEVPPGPQWFLATEWINDAEPSIPDITIGIDPTDPWPVSGIKGYSITHDGSTPDALIDAFATLDYEVFPAPYAVAELTEGITELRARSVSYSGMASDGVAVALLRVDRSPPFIGLKAPQPLDGWLRDVATIGLTASDQDGLSGMIPAPLDVPVEEGAYVACKLGSGAPQRFRGEEGTLEVDDDGRHTLTYWAVDAAGNSSGEKSVSFKIDRTPPSGAFGPTDPSDPRQLRVQAFDATSGVAGGRVELRREGDGFTALPTRLENGQLLARIDDLALERGRYELRALVRDVAGNEAVIDRRWDGGEMRMALPVRELARVEVAGVQRRVRRCPKAKGPRARKRGQRGRKCGKGRLKVEQIETKRLQLPHGRRARTTGRVVTGSGTPIAGATVVVEGQPRSGGPFSRLGSIRTDARGAFSFVAPAGPSRTLRYRYEGSNTVRPAAGELVTKVKAAATLRVDRKRLVNGQAVRFLGRLPGKPIPPAGKLVALQARVGREWRTFATPRANARGVFRHRYRFTATTGLRRYAFRALVAREAAYPYERGVSRTVHVTVRGR
jgi:hypothetical protein